MMADFLLLSRLEEYINRRKILPAYFQKSAGAYGVFTPYTSFADCTCAQFLGDNAGPTECFVKFALMCEKAGGADSARDIRGMFARFLKSCRACGRRWEKVLMQIQEMRAGSGSLLQIILKV